MKILIHKFYFKSIYNATVLEPHYKHDGLLSLTRFIYKGYAC